MNIVKVLFSFYLREEKKHIKVERDLSKRKKKDLSD
jgi:hypothetical protein